MLGLLLPAGAGLIPLEPGWILQDGHPQIQLWTSPNPTLVPKYWEWPRSRLCVSTHGAAEPRGSGRVWDQPHPGWKMGQVGAVPVPCRCQELNPNPAELWDPRALQQLPLREGKFRLVPGFWGIQGGISAQSPGCGPAGSDPALGSRYTNPRTGRFRSGDATQCRVLFVLL